MKNDRRDTTPQRDRPLEIPTSSRRIGLEPDAGLGISTEHRHLGPPRIARTPRPFSPAERRIGRDPRPPVVVALELDLDLALDLEAR
jgi:hypothetical protein